MSNFDNRHNLFTQSIINTETGTNARKLYDVSVQELNTLETNYNLLSDLLDIDYTTDVLLDNLATLVGTSRLPGESDVDLKKKIITTALSKSSNGTIPNLISIIKAFDPVNDYEITENPYQDFTHWDGSVLLDGYESMDAETKATIHIQREVDDTDTVNYSIADFIQAAKVGGVNACLSVFMNLTTCTHYVAPAMVTIQNTEKVDDLGTLDGSKLFEQYVGQYTVTDYKILDVNGNVVKEAPFKPRFYKGTFIYSALLRESEANGKQIKTIQFFDGVTLNFECVLSTPIFKKQSLRLTFMEKNL